MDSLQVAARELETRWKWAEARLDVDWSATAAFGRVRPQPAKPTDGEKDEIERLRTRNDGLANMDDDGLDRRAGRRSRVQRNAPGRDRNHARGPRSLSARGYRHRRVHRHRRQRRRAQTDPGPGQARGHARARTWRCGTRPDTTILPMTEENTISGIDAPTFVASPRFYPAMRKPRRARKWGVGIGLADDLAGHPHGHRQEPARLRLQGGL